MLEAQRYPGLALTPKGSYNLSMVRARVRVRARLGVRVRVGSGDESVAAALQARGDG